MTTQALNRPVDVLARAVFAAYTGNSGHSPDDHYARSAAEQWMAQALTECLVADLLDVARRAMEPIDPKYYTRDQAELVNLLARIGGDL